MRSLNIWGHPDCRLAPSLFRQQKNGKGKGRGKGESTVSARLITDDEIDLGQVYPDWKVCRMRGDLSYVQIACSAVFVSLNNRTIVSFCCFTKISRLEPRLKFKVHGREIGRAWQTFQSGGHGPPAPHRLRAWEWLTR